MSRNSLPKDAWCSYCRASITGSGYRGRLRADEASRIYCCYGCLSLGESPQKNACADLGCTTGWKLDGVGLRLGIGILVTGQSMIFGLALNLHDDVPLGTRWLIQSLILCSTVGVFALLGVPLLRAAWGEARRGKFTTEALFLLTIVGAMAASLQAHVTGRGGIYFEVVSILLVVYTLGKVIGARTRSRAIAESSLCDGELATCRRVDPAGESRVVPVTAVTLGDVIDVYPGERVAVDGVIRDGIGFMSESPVSGEPYLVVRRPGDRVLAGVASYDSSFRIVATAHGTERQVDHLLTAIDEARTKPATVQAQADRLGRVFFPLVVLTAMGTFCYWALLTDRGWEGALLNAMSVLLVACPCVIGLATPLVVWNALARLAERGVVVRSGDAVERLAAVDVVVLDKTGTLTEDHFTLLDIATTATGRERERVLAWLSLIEERSRHPIARALADLPRSFEAGCEPSVKTVRIIPGCGVEAVLVEPDTVQHTIQIGTSLWIASISRAPVALARSLRATGHRIDAAIDGELATCAVVSERVRHSSADMLAAFRALGLPVEVSTGDREDRATDLGIPSVRANQLPADKRARIEELKAVGGKPLMVGDGINDASALAAAHVGIALSAGTDLAVDAADATLYHDDLRVIPWAVALSRGAVRAVRWNLYRAAAFNVVGMALAACGWLHPVAAAALMGVSSVSLIVSATRFREKAARCHASSGMDAAPDQSQPMSLLQAFVHFGAIVLQGVCLLLLLQSTLTLTTSTLIFLGTLCVAAGVVYSWFRWSNITHRLDMVFGMLTLGNLGMLAGWWADIGFEPVRCATCCSCTDPFHRPWMWIGMLACSNIAMLWLGRHAIPHDRDHRLAMFTGGNLGMVLGMLLGGWSATLILTHSVFLIVASHLLLMTLGMVLGMLLGTRLTEGVIAVACRSAEGPDEVERREAEADCDDGVPDVVGR